MAEQVEPHASVESAMASVKEEATKTAVEIQSEQIKELQSVQSSDAHFQWLEDAAQVSKRRSVHLAHIHLVRTKLYM